MTEEKVYEVDQHLDPDFGDYETVWMCEPPPKGMTFKVTEQEWNEDYTVRTIRAISLSAVMDPIWSALEPGS